MAKTKPVPQTGSTTAPKGPTHAPLKTPKPATNPIDTHPKSRGAPTNPPGHPLAVGNWGASPGPGVAPHPNGTSGTPGTGKVPTSAHAIVNNFLAQYGLQALGAWAWNRYTALGGGPDALNQISIEMTQQPAFNQRFPAYKKLAEEGEAMSPAEMISYEQTAKQIFHNAGIPEGFYDTPAELATFMENNVSATELKSRVDLATAAVTTAPADVRDQLQRMYGLTPGALTAYYLDPTKALPVIQQQFTAAQIGAEGTRTGVGQLSTSQAEHLAQIGVTDATAQQGFGHLGDEAGLFQQQRTGESGIGLDTQLAAEFDNSAAAKLRILKQQQSRTADFQGNSGENLGQGGVGGLGSTDKSA